MGSVRWCYGILGRTDVIRLGSKCSARGTFAFANALCGLLSSSMNWMVKQHRKLRSAYQN